MAVTNEEFFRWVQTKSEHAWSRTKDGDLLESGVMGTIPSERTRWTGGLSEQEIAACEHRYARRFPRAYRAMLRTLGGTTPMSHVGYHDGDTPTVSQVPGWLDPRTDDALIRARLDGLPETLWPAGADEPGSGLLWPATFGADPGAREGRLHAISKWLERASPAWPMFGHRYMIIDSDADTAVVLSIWHCCDVVEYGASVEDYLLRELELSQTEAPRYERGHERTAADFALWAELLG
jgi:hypothetical protein